jgi:hypothetical protein
VNGGGKGRRGSRLWNHDRVLRIFACRSSRLWNHNRVRRIFACRSSLHCLVYFGAGPNYSHFFVCAHPAILLEDSIAGGSAGGLASENSNIIILFFDLLL